jgi:8-oxo-dGTP pyrophosphatase MutT (NUDIX family)
MSASFFQAGEPVESDLATYLNRHSPGPTEEAAWLDGSLRLRSTSFLSDVPPPLAYVNSVRCVVFDGALVLVLTNQHSRHILPGGRRERDEPLLSTLRREVREETGWAVTQPTLLGFTYFHVLPPRPPGYTDPHAGFINVVYEAEVLTHDPAGRLVDDYEAAWTLTPVSEARALPLSAADQFFLAAALARGVARPRTSGP